MLPCTPAIRSGCRSNTVQQLFCDIASLLKLSCSDTFSNKVTAAVSSLVIGGGCFVFILRSYVHIFSTVLRLPAGADRKKELLHLCPPHSHGVSPHSSGFYIYLRPSEVSATTQDIALSVFYSIIPQLFNPVTVLEMKK
ncbi:Olfactory receptor 14C36 [Sciurus carolinensis]|uniref:Olfactory receptor 14C36 n=1 Tax=Sciurus carolinensis TaxID=30640 RepID=A0AA41MPK3_SCICA|nr:Olfactory receptor 14C36 [Sciurus carolinensis]